MAGKGGSGGGSQWSHQQHQHQQHQNQQPTSSHLLSPNSAASRTRRRSTLSNHGFFIEYSGRRNSCAPNQHRQPPLAHLALVSPVRGSGGPTAAVDNEACETSGQSPVRMGTALGGRQSQASCSTRMGQQQLAPGPHSHRSHSLMPPISAPSALLGSRKTSIFDPAGHSLASSQLLGTSAAAAAAAAASSCDVTRRRSTMTMGPAALAAQQQMLAVAKNHSAAGANACKTRAQTLVQQVPVIGCSPTSIQGSLQALDESRRYEKMLRTLREHQKQKEIRRRKRRSRLQAIPRSTSQQQQQQQREESTTAGREEDGHSLRRAIKNAAKGLLGARASHQPQTLASGSARHEQVRLSVSALSLGSWSTSNESGSGSCATSDSELASRGSSAASLSPNTERLTLGNPNEATNNRRQKSFMSQAFRKLASLSASSPSVSAIRHHSTRSAPPPPSAAGNSTANQNYWHYFYYLKENSIDHSPCLGADEPLVAGELLSPKKRLERLNANFSLARLEILNCGATCRPNPGDLMQAHELAAQGKPEMLARMFSQSTDISLALSTSSSSQHSSTSDLSLMSSSSHAPRDTDEPEDSSAENWSVSSSIQLESTAARLSSSSSDESTATAVGQHARRPISWARSAPSSNDTPTIETSFNTRQATVCKSSPHSSFSSKSVVKKNELSTPRAGEDEEEEEDDFERLNRCHRGYKLKAAELLEMMQQQEPAKRSRRDSSQRLSVRSVRSIGSPGGFLRDSSKSGKNPSGAASTNLTSTHAISLSWGTLNQVQTSGSSQRLAAVRRPQLASANPAAPPSQDCHGTLNTGSQLTPTRPKAEAARRCTSASLGPPNLRRHRLVQSKSDRLNISANDLALGSVGSTGNTGNPSNRQSLAAGELRARAHSTGSKWNQPEASKLTPARLSGSSCLLARAAASASTRVEPPPPPRGAPLLTGFGHNSGARAASSSQQPPPDGRRAARANSRTEEPPVCTQDERLQLFELVRKGSFSCMVLGARQTGKRSIVKCFVKLLNEFKLAVAEYRKEKMLTQLLGCSQQLQGILQQREEDAGSGNGPMRARVNSWFAGGPVNRLLTSNSGRQARNSTCLADRGLGRQSSPGLSERADADNQIANNNNNNNKSPDNRFLCVASAHGINKSDTSIDYQSTTHENGNFSLSFQVPTTTLHTRSLGPAESASARERTQKRRARSKLRRLLSLKELNKKRVRIRFSSRRKLATRRLPRDSLSSETYTPLLDVYLVVYAINDRDSFTEAGRLLKELSTLRRANNPARYVPVILVANKVDLERAKVVKNEEGKALARKHQCKFMEISCAVGFNLDNLLVGIRTQLVLKHHVDLNSYLGNANRTTTDNKTTSRQVSDKGAVGKIVREQGKSSTDANRKQNIIMRFYRRYVTNNFAEDNYDCDNFSVL